MANLTTSDNISHHLTDSAGTPLLSSSQSASGRSQSQSQAQALSSLTTTAMTAYDTASRLGLGLPQRVLIETTSPGPVILHSYINSQPSQQQRPSTNGQEIVEQAREDLRSLSSTTEGTSVMAGEEGVNGAVVNGGDYGKDVVAAQDEEEEEGTSRQIPPMLVATIVAASVAEVGEAKRLAARLERMGKEFQREWVKEQEAQAETATGSGEVG